MALGKFLQYWTDHSALPSDDPNAKRQFGAIPYTLVRGQVVFLLITSRGSGRWIFPKGDPMEGLEPWETAAQEAIEEAGVEGDVEITPIGSYRTMKSLAIRRTVIEVDMFPLKLTRQMDDWPEKQKRHRHWVFFLKQNAYCASLALRSLRRASADASSSTLS